MTGANLFLGNIELINEFVQAKNLEKLAVNGIYVTLYHCTTWISIVYRGGKRVSGLYIFLL